MAASSYGVPASCPASIRECNADRMASQCCISITLRELIVPCGAPCWTRIDDIDRQTHTEFGNPETVTRIAQYEMAFRMQMDATDAMDIHKEPESCARDMVVSLLGRNSPTTAWWHDDLPSEVCASSSFTIGMGFSWC
jgi:hypothetical protein